MAKLKFKSNGKWESIAAFQGEPGKDGAIQYTAGKGITIENDAISAEVDKQYVDEAIAGIEIPESASAFAKEYIYDIADSSYNMNSDKTLSATQKTNLINLLNQVITDGNTNNYKVIVTNSKPYTSSQYQKRYTISDSHSSTPLQKLGASASNATVTLTGCDWSPYFDDLPSVYKMVIQLTGVYTNADGLITTVVEAKIDSNNGRMLVFGSGWGTPPALSFSNDPVSLTRMTEYLTNNNYMKKDDVDNAITSAITTALEADY